MTKRKFLISYVILLHFFLIFLILNPYSSDQRKRNPGLFPQSDEFPSPPAHQTELTEHYHRMLKYHKLMDGSVSNGTAVFIGDSMVQSLWVSGIAPLSVNYGIGGDTTVGVLNRISQYKSIERANIVVIAVGLNDMEFRNIDEIFENYKKIANSISGNTPIIFSAVLPVNEHARNNMQGRNKQIRSLNMKLKQFCDTSERLHYVDIGQQLIDSDANLDMQYSDGGVHLNSKGNAMWTAVLRDTVSLATNRSH